MDAYVDISDLSVDDINIDLDLDSETELDDFSTDDLLIDDLEFSGIQNELDPTVPPHVKNITENEINYWNDWDNLNNFDIERICQL